jgi:DNA-binding NtrC family response regulator
MAIAPQIRRVLLVEPSAAESERAAQVLDSSRYEVTRCSTTSEAREQLRARGYDAILAAIEVVEADPEARIREFKRRARTAPLLLLCPPERVRYAVRLLALGVDDYVLRPPDPLEMEARLGRIFDSHELDSRVHFFQAEISKKSGFVDLEARSPGMLQLTNQLKRVAPMRSTVLIFGESGAGKELVARSIHFNSTRRDQPFVALNCAAIPSGLIESELFGHEKGSFTGAHARVRGKFEIAHRGTLFLDEIGEMARATQAKLLRVLEQREFMRIGGDRRVRVDVRLIAATNADLEQLVAERGFRQDLYYRLKVVTLTVPPLRERREDIAALALLFIDQLARANAIPPKRLTPAAVAALGEYAWPGNVRELKNVLENMLVSVAGEVIHLEDLPNYIRGARSSVPFAELPGEATLAEMEREMIRNTLVRTGGNRTHTAELLGIGVRTLQRKIRSYGLSIPPRRRRPRQKIETG